MSKYIRVLFGFAGVLIGTMPWSYDQRTLHHVADAVVLTAGVILISSIWEDR